MTHRYSGLVFDKDGTLFDFAKTWESWAQSILARLAPEPDMVPVLGAAIGYNTTSGQFSRESVVIAGTVFEIAQALSAQLPDISLPDITRILNVEAANAPQVEAAQLEPLLRQLRHDNYRLGIATNDAEAPARAHLDSVAITKYFDFIAGYDSGHGAKPGPGQLNAFCQATGLSPNACVMIGDSLHDLRAGKAAEFATVGVLTGYASEEQLSPYADVVLPHIGHLPDWLAAQ